MHSGYGFSIGGIAAMDMENPEAVVSPGMSLTRASSRRWCRLRYQLRCPSDPHEPLREGRRPPQGGARPEAVRQYPRRRRQHGRPPRHSREPLGGPRMHSSRRRSSRTWVWTGVSVRATASPKTRSTARSTAACSRPTAPRYVPSRLPDALGVRPCLPAWCPSVGHPRSRQPLHRGPGRG